MRLYEDAARRFCVLTFQEGKGMTGLNFMGLNNKVCYLHPRSKISNDNYLRRLLMTTLRPLLAASMSTQRISMAIIRICADSRARMTMAM